MLLIISVIFIFFVSHVPPSSLYNRPYSMIGDLSLFRVSYSHRTVISVEVTSASIFSGGYGPVNIFIRKVCIYKTQLENALCWPYPLDTGCKLNVHNTFRRRPECLLNVFLYVKFTSCDQGVDVWRSPGSASAFQKSLQSQTLENRIKAEFLKLRM